MTTEQAATLIHTLWSIDLDLLFIFLVLLFKLK